MEQIGFYFDQTRCTGCYTCVVACKDWHDVPAGPASWLRITTRETGKYPSPSISHLFHACNHCAEPLCALVCPAGAIEKKGDTGAVVVDRQKCREAARCGMLSHNGNVALFRDQRAPCQVECPVHIDVPGYVALIRQNRYDAALNLMRQSMPLPGVCGRVCHAPCEVACSRQQVDEPVAIEALKRFASDNAMAPLPKPLARVHAEKVAVIGSGPAGLAAAYDLVREGYPVTVFEALPVAGGMLAVGIPEYRLPKAALARDIDYITGLGVDIRLNSPVGRSGLKLDDLREQGYQAIFLASGAHASRKLNIAGENLDGVLQGIEFLRDVNLGKPVKLGHTVAVIGGGNVAIDSSRTALRLGAKEVTVFYRRTDEEMPALRQEVVGAREEGVKIRYLEAPVRILGQNAVAGIEFVRMELGGPDASGRRSPTPVPGSQFELAADTVIVAVGQSPNLDTLPEKAVLHALADGVSVVADSLRIGDVGISVGGDAAGGRGTVVDAIAAGQEAARAIDSYLKCGLVRKPVTEAIELSAVRVEVPPDIGKANRQSVSKASIERRTTSFAEVDLGLDEQAAVAEAGRCLNCAGHLCLDVCPYAAPQFGEEEGAKMQKCDLCLERWPEGQKPICVEACPMRALDAGPLEALRARYGDVRQAREFEYSEELKPSIIFKKKPRKT